jgi:hypothetical protein
MSLAIGKMVLLQDSSLIRIAYGKNSFEYLDPSPQPVHTRRDDFPQNPDLELKVRP